MGDWTDVYPLYSVTETTTPITSDVDLEGVRSQHILQVSVTANGGGTQIVWFQGSLDGVSWYDLMANPQGFTGNASVAYTSSIPARHIHAVTYTTSGTNTVTVTGASA